MLQVDAPYSDGRMFFRSDFVNMNVGSFSTNADGKWDDNWGTCTLQDCSGNRSQSIPVPAWRSAGEMTSGAGISVPRRWASTWWMWSAASVAAMISGPLGYTVNAHRRPISSSFAGLWWAKDSPSNTGKMGWRTCRRCGAKSELR